MTSEKENTAAQRQVEKSFTVQLLLICPVSGGHVVGTESSISSVDVPLPLGSVEEHLSPGWKDESGCWKVLSGTGSVSYASSTKKKSIINRHVMTYLITLHAFGQHKLNRY